MQLCCKHTEVFAAADMPKHEKAFNEAITSIRERYPERLAAYLRTDIQGP
jgi:hypothetical protein